MAVHKKPLTFSLKMITPIMMEETTREIATKAISTYSVVRQALSHTAVNPLLDCCHDDLQHLTFSRAELLFMPPEDGRQDISADQSRITGSQAAAGRRNGKTLFHLLQQPFTVNPMHMFVEYAVKKGMDNVSYIPGFQSVHNPKNEVQIKLII